MRVVVLSFAVGGLAACYSPNAFIESCALPCDKLGSCPEGLVCTDEVCAAPGETCEPITKPGCVRTRLLGEVCPPARGSDPTFALPDVDATECSAPYEHHELGGVAACVAFAETIQVHQWRGTGDRPVAIIATQSVSISGFLDVGSYADVGSPGAGAGRGCSMPALAGQSGTGSSPNGGGGGAGGSFQGAGGAGGAGERPDAVALGGPAGEAQPFGLRGGCGGAVGGASAVTGSGVGEAGFSGGGVYIVAPTITFEDGPRILAGGSGGLPGGAEAGGGGGGGSGGAIVFESSQLTVSGELPTICANGGGGGGGGSGNLAGTRGKNGCEGGISPATGGPSAATPQGDGGTGSNRLAVDGTDGRFSTDGGGGGAGGAGYIVVFGVPDISVLGDTISPQPKATP